MESMCWNVSESTNVRRNVQGYYVSEIANLCAGIHACCVLFFVFEYVYESANRCSRIDACGVLFFIFEFEIWKP
ncbi:hypothetical protein HanRHA438_Chr03g0102601 [Helianthus annuus]|nr:hypothetical protein HanRHA438_Chr03g0102601 [Helianthus annuus]